MSSLTTRRLYKNFSFSSVFLLKSWERYFVFRFDSNGWWWLWLNQWGLIQITSEILPLSRLHLTNPYSQWHFTFHLNSFLSPFAWIFFCFFILHFNISIKELTKLWGYKTLLFKFTYNFIISSIKFTFNFA